MALATPTSAATAAGPGRELEAPTEGVRPTLRLPWRQLLMVSVYWFGIQAIWGGYEAFGQEQVELMVGTADKGLTIGIIESLGAMVALFVQPTAGVLSDYTSTRWGRRKAYIIVGATMDLVFLAGLALVALQKPDGWDRAGLASFEGLALYTGIYLCLQFSSNLAQGPFQGYMPDLVPEAQVGKASTIIGVMRPMGLIGGGLVMAVLGVWLGLWGLALVLIGLTELSLAVLTCLFVQNGPPGRPRERRSWWSIAGEAWGMDVARERPFLLMSTVRFLFLMGTGIFVNVQLWYLTDSQGIADEARTVWILAGNVIGVVTAVIAALVATPVSDRTGRKPVIWVAVAIAATGIAIIAVASPAWVALPGIALMGLGSGAYLAVDWALMTEVIPLASTGRFMGLANVANSLATPVGLVCAGLVIDFFTKSGNAAMGPRAGVALGVVFLIGAAITLVGVHPRRDPRLVAAAPA